MSLAFDHALEWLRKVCAALPEVSERMSHGSPGFFIQGKRQFVVLRDNHHGDGRLGLWLAAPLGVQESLKAENPDWFFVPPYVGHRGWIGVRLDRSLDLRVAAEYVTDGYATIAPAKLVTAMKSA